MILRSCLIVFVDTTVRSCREPDYGPSIRDSQSVASRALSPCDISSHSSGLPSGPQRAYPGAGNAGAHLCSQNYRASLGDG